MIALMVVVGFFFRITIFLCRNTEIERQMRQIVSSVTNNGGELISELSFPYSIFRNYFHNILISTNFRTYSCLESLGVKKLGGCFRKDLNPLRLPYSCASFAHHATPFAHATLSL